MKGKKIIIILTAIVLIITGIIAGMKYSEYHSEKIMAENLELGERYLTEQDYEAAVVAFSKVIEADPKCVDAYLKVSDAYIGLGDYDSAIEQLEKGYAETGDESIHQTLLDRMMELGEWYLTEQDYKAAAAAFSKVIQADPKCVDAYLKVADAYIGFGDYDSAIEWLEKGYAETGDESIHQKLLEIRPEISEEATKLLQGLYKLMEAENYEGAMDYMGEHEAELEDVYCNQMREVIALFDGNQFQGKIDGTGMVFQAYPSESDDSHTYKYVTAFWGQFRDGVPHGKNTVCDWSYSEEKVDDYVIEGPSRYYMIGEWENGKANGEAKGRGHYEDYYIYTTYEETYAFEIIQEGNFQQDVFNGTRTEINSDGTTSHTTIAGGHETSDDGGYTEDGLWMYPWTFNPWEVFRR